MISSFLIVTPAGQIVIDTGDNQTLKQTEGNIERFGLVRFRPRLPGQLENNGAPCLRPRRGERYWAIRERAKRADGTDGIWREDRAESQRLGFSLQNRIIARLEKLEEFQAAHPVVDPEKSPAFADLIVFAPNLKGR